MCKMPKKKAELYRGRHSAHHPVVDRDKQCDRTKPCQWTGDADRKWSFPILHALHSSAVDSQKAEQQIKRCNPVQISVGIVFNCAKQLQVRNESEKGRIAPAFRYFCFYLITVLFSHPPLPRTVPGESRCRGGLRSNLHRTESWCHPDSQTAAPARMLFRVHRYLPCCGS